MIYPPLDWYSFAQVVLFAATIFLGILFLGYLIDSIVELRHHKRKMKSLKDMQKAVRQAIEEVEKEKKTEKKKRTFPVKKTGSEKRGKVGSKRCLVCKVEIKHPSHASQRFHNRACYLKFIRANGKV